MDPADTLEGQSHFDRPAWGPMTSVACLWIGGLLAGQIAPIPALWLGVAVALGGAAVLMALRTRTTGARCWGSLAIVAVAAAWMPLSRQVGDDDISHFAGEQPQLADVTGAVHEVSHFIPPDQGLDRYLFRPPSTRFTLAAQSILVEGASRPASGTVMVRLAEHDHRVRAGDRIEVTGWLRRIGPASNPGQFDYRKHMADRGIYATMRAPDRGNWRRLDSPGWLPSLRHARDVAAQAAADSLRLGMRHHPRQAEFLDAILLGRRGPQFSELFDSFRDVGLAHLLAISGAHLGILLGLTWLTASILVSRPKKAAAIVLLVLAFFLLVVPLRVPILRASLMASLFTLGYASGRLVRAIDALALAALLVLIWSPLQLFALGFQLSFAVTAALVLLVKPACFWLRPTPGLDLQPGRLTTVIGRKATELVVASLVAASVGVPLSTYHFGLLTPMSALLTIPAIPFVAVGLWLGYIKTVVGIVVPSAGAFLAGPTSAVASFMTWSVQAAGTLPGASIDLAVRPSLLWLITVSAVTVAFWLGLFKGRARALIAAVALCSVWLFIATRPETRIAQSRSVDAPIAIRLNMISVGDGSAYLLRVPGPGGSADSGDGGHTMLFDCGSLVYLDVGQRVIVPALKALGVGKVDTLFVSHANLDHYNGCLPVAEQLGIGRVLMTSRTLSGAARRSDSPTAEFIESLRRMGLEPQPVAQGWNERWGDATVDVMWPPDDLEIPEANDASIVLKVTSDRASVLLTGDIQDFAQRRLIESSRDLQASVSDLPHHGGFVRSSLDWVDAVSSRLVIQSAGSRRMRYDKWAGPLSDRSIERLVTAALGEVRIDLGRDGAIAWEGFLRGRGEIPARPVEAVRSLREP